MVEQDALRLKAGDPVVWSDGTPGRVVQVEDKCIVFQFDGDEGQSYLHPADCAKVEVPRG